MINDPWPTNFSTGGFDLDAVGVVHEKTLPADINGDGIVNLADYADFSAAWQSEPFNPNWDYRCDLVPFIDDIISMDDFFVMMNQWLLTELWYNE